MRSHWTFLRKNSSSVIERLSWVCEQMIRRWAYAMRNDPVDKRPARLFLLSVMSRCRLHIHSQRIQAPELGRGPFKGSREWESDQLPLNCPALVSNPSGPGNRCWQTLWPRLNPAFEWDNKTGFVHLFEMWPNYVWLINETLCPHRRDTVEKWSESALYRKRLMKFSEGIRLPEAGLRQREIFGLQILLLFPYHPFFLKYV